ncbi:MAG: hypothetical protein JSW00_09105 [Thermoplasmata archaeon]|nr:MAG: hypothetical protein JSW00_09105 [Thermoplasmata archaeon]
MFRKKRHWGEKIIITWDTYLYTGIKKPLSIKDTELASQIGIWGFLYR